MRREICLCREISLCRDRLRDVKIRVWVLMHHRERLSTTNTGRLAALTLPEGKIFYRGSDPRLGSYEELPTAKPETTLLLYPTVDAIELSSDWAEKKKVACPEGLTLIVPDGSWRQASKVPKREKALENVQCIRLPDLGPSRYLLRREPKAGGLATFEAIARTLGFFEGKAVQSAMERLFDLMVQRTLLSRVGILKEVDPVES